MSDRQKTSQTSWAIFDAEWYQRRYYERLTEQEKAPNQTQLEKTWKENTIYRGYSPNRYFDEEWYLIANTTLKKTIKKGGIFENSFQHYCEIGYRHATPHWLFSEADYFKKNQDISFRKITQQGYKNGYDHFIKTGDKERRKISLFFDHEIFIYSCFQENIHFSFQEGIFSQYLSLKNKDYASLRTSWYFDPKYYLLTYPEVETSIKNGQYISALHHYFCNHSPMKYNPNPYFDEEYYLNTYPDVKEEINNGTFRNSYEYFLKYGIKRGDRPHSDINLNAFCKEIGDIQTRLIQEKVNDIFSLFIKYKENNVSYKINHINNSGLQYLFQKRIETKLTSLFRSPLYFNNNLPINNLKKEITIIIISQGNYIYSIETLLSLYEQDIPCLEIILASNGNDIEKNHLSHCFKNIKLIFSQHYLSEEELAAKALKQATSDNILFLYAGCTLALGSLRALLSSITKYNLHAACPQIIKMNGAIKEASSLMWRDGNLHLCNEDDRPYNNEVSAIKEINCFNHSVFYAKKTLLEKIWNNVLNCGLRNNFLSVSISLKEINEKIFYIPEFIVKDARQDNRSYLFKDVIKENIRYYFPNFISQQAIPHEAAGSLMTNSPRKENILFICQKIPLYQKTTSERKFLSLINIFKKMNWHVTVVSLEKQNEKINENFGIILEYPREIKFLIGEDYLNKIASSHINITWIIGTETLSRIEDFIKKGENGLSSSMIILDSVALDGKGLRATEKYLTEHIENNQTTKSLLQLSKEELSSAWLCQAILALNNEEKKIIKNAGYGNVISLPAYLPNEFKMRLPLKPFSSREGLLFSLPIYKDNGSNHDALKWLCFHIIPFLRKKLSQDIPIWIGNKIQGGFDLSFYERYSQIEIMPEKSSYEELLQKCRIVVIPSRKMTLYPLEILEAAEYGLPAIIGEPFCHDLGLKEGEEILSGGFNDPELFAEKISDLYMNETLWNKISKNIHRIVRENYTEEHYEHSLKEFLASLGKTKRENAPKRIIKTEFKPAPLKTRFKQEEKEDDKDISFCEEEDIKEDEDFIPKTRLGVSLEN